MTESIPSLGDSRLEGSDQLPGSYCEPCYEASDKVKTVVGHCKNCDENLCRECYTSHCGLKIFRSHKLVNISARPNLKPTTKNGFKKKVREYLPAVALIIVAIVLTSILNFHTEEMSKLARNIQDTQDVRNLKDVVNDVKKVRDEFVDLMTRTETQAAIVKKEDLTLIENIVNEQMNKMTVQFETLQKNVNENLLTAMKHALDQRQSLEVKLDKLQDEFVDRMTQSEKQTHNVNEEDFKKMEKIVMEQNNKKTVHLETLKENNKNESLLIAMKNAQDQLLSLEEKFDKLDKDNTVKIVKAILKVKMPIHVKDITVTDSTDEPFHLFGSLVLPNKQILITDYGNKKLKIIDTNLDKIISQLQLSGRPNDITKVKEDEVAVSVEGSPHTIQFIFISKNSMSKVREFKCDGRCEGIVYNERDHTLIVTFIVPPKVKILDIAGTEIKSMRDDLFTRPYGVALTPDMTNIYVTDWLKNSVTFLSLNGDVKAVYKDKTGSLDGPYGVYVHTSGLVYVVGGWSDTVHELDPETGEFKVLLENKDGISNPRSISYCELEEKMYIGTYNSSVLKIFNMKFDNRK